MQMYAEGGGSSQESAANIHMTFLGWAVLLMVLYGLNKNRTGHEVIFYGMFLIVLFLFVGNWAKVKPLLIKGGTQA